jgi:hypothetical protein
MGKRLPCQANRQAEAGRSLGKRLAAQRYLACQHHAGGALTKRLACQEECWTREAARLPERRARERDRAAASGRQRRGCRRSLAERRAREGDRRDRDRAWQRRAKGDLAKLAERRAENSRSDLCRVRQRIVRTRLADRLAAQSDARPDFIDRRLGRAKHP